MAVQSALSLVNLFYCGHEAGTAASQCQEGEVFRRINGFRTAPSVSSLGARRFDAGYRQALFPAPGMARKVIVACSNVTLPAVVGAPVIGGASSPAPGAGVVPSSRTVVSRKPAASRVKRSEALGSVSECGALRSVLITK